MLPDDDPSRALTIAQAETDSGLPHVALVGDVYTILVTGEQTGGRYALIDVFVPPGGGGAASPPRSEGALVPEAVPDDETCEE